ncbi:MAG TPA: glycosyltransferase, partial [Gemmatimonadales bacterium]|nr:glycosyltransferase [Gemmatimonadales bacterium]
MNRAIVHVASGREWRGGQRQVWLLARELSRRGVPQVVVTGRGSELASRLTMDGIPVRTVPWKLGLDPRVLRSILGESHFSAVLHAHDAHALTLASLSALLTRTPLVVTRRVTFPIRHRYFWHRACRIIAISRAVAEALLRDGMQPERVVVIPSAVDPESLRSDPWDLRSALRLPATSQLAVHLGALTPEKDQQTLLRAAARLVRDLPELHWVIVGEGRLRSALQREIVDLDLNERVHLMGALPDPDRALGQADVFVLSSLSEGLGSSALAAMAQGVPVVATRVGGLPELLEPGNGVLVEPRDPTALAAAVARVLDDSGFRSNLIAGARTQAARFS